ncbi:Putative Kinetoplast-associated protein kap [Penicillium brasilianum]|uniref:Putative Kinetoplast-associated protein kap n=1 Tax=Penicillium brasilianum TaxID=104259 RepID=A0A0F7VCI5_PENBI|nr:Putative Kinetoplast-associated protein kap [Penicillium brasilianum]
MSFGFSVGDFLAGANLAYRLIRALSESRGSNMEYQEVIQELGCIQHTFLHVELISSRKVFSQATINAIAHILGSSMEVMERFLQQTEKYRKSLSRNGGRSLAADSWRKIGWSLFQKEELISLRSTLQTRLTAVNILVSAANSQNYYITPQAVGKFQTSSFETRSCQALSHVSSEATTAVAGDSSGDYGAEMYAKVEDQSLVHNPSEWQRDEAYTKVEDQTHANISSEEHQDEISTEVVEAPSYQRLSNASCKTTITAIGNPSGGQRDEVYNKTKYQNQGHMQREAILENAPHIKEAKDYLGGESGENGEYLRRKLAELEAVQVLAKLGMLQAHPSSQLPGILHATTVSNEKKKPIKFKDAVGRKFSFPFELGCTWQGMEDLINQAFLHVEVIGPHVAKGHYDLVGPNGEIILPQVWDSVIEPDWTVTMHMWPIPEAPKEPDILPPDTI